MIDCFLLMKDLLSLNLSCCRNLAVLKYASCRAVDSFFHFSPAPLYDCQAASLSRSYAGSLTSSRLLTMDYLLRWQPDTMTMKMLLFSVDGGSRELVRHFGSEASSFALFCLRLVADFACHLSRHY